jgi:hypothetical protein
MVHSDPFLRNLLCNGTVVGQQDGSTASPRGGNTPCAGGWLAAATTCGSRPRPRTDPAPRVRIGRAQAPQVSTGPPRQRGTAGRHVPGRLFATATSAPTVGACENGDRRIGRPRTPTGCSSPTTARSASDSSAVSPGTAFASLRFIEFCRTQLGPAPTVPYTSSVPAHESGELLRTHSRASQRASVPRG